MKASLLEDYLKYSNSNTNYYKQTATNMAAADDYPGKPSADIMNRKAERESILGTPGTYYFLK